jgi:hypothetical protein
MTKRVIIISARRAKGLHVDLMSCGIRIHALNDCRATRQAASVAASMLRMHRPSTCSRK